MHANPHTPTHRERVEIVYQNFNMNPTETFNFEQGATETTMYLLKTSLSYSK